MLEVAKSMMHGPSPTPTRNASGARWSLPSGDGAAGRRVNPQSASATKTRAAYPRA
jgi:hypothetical protein